MGVSNTIRGAVANWSKTLAEEVASFGITVNNVLPGFTDTERLAEIIKIKANSTGTSIEEMTEIMKSNIEAIKELKPYGYEGFLIGENFMKTDDAGESAKQFIKNLKS